MRFVEANESHLYPLLCRITKGFHECRKKRDSLKSYSKPLLLMSYGNDGVAQHRLSRCFLGLLLIVFVCRDIALKRYVGCGKTDILFVQKRSRSNVHGLAQRPDGL